MGTGLETASQHQPAYFEVHLAGAAGDPCLGDHQVTAELKCLLDSSVAIATVSRKTPAAFEGLYCPTRYGEHELTVQINGVSIWGSPFQVMVDNIPYPSNCTATGMGLEVAETAHIARFDVHLADAVGDPCITTQDVTAELKSIVNGSVIEAKVVGKTLATYEVSYQPSVRGRHDLSVGVNGMPIQHSPFRVYVRQSPRQLGKPIRVIRGLNEPRGLVTTKKGEVIVCEKNRISKDGKKIKTIESVQMSYNRGVAVDDSGNVYITEQNSHRLIKLNSDGKLVKSVGGKGEKPGQFDHPDGIAVSNNNKVFVCDQANHRVQIFDTDLIFISCFGTKGSGEGEFQHPSDLSIDCAGNLYAADQNNNCIQVFSQSGKYLRTLGEEGLGRGELRKPCGIHVDHGRIYVTEWGNHCVSVLTTSGEFITSFGSFGLGEKSFICPVGITTDEDGYVYVCDTHNNRIQVF